MNLHAGNINFLPLLLLLAIVAACSGSADVDARTALPGTWDCDDIRLELKSNGRYEWHVPHDDDYTLQVMDSEMMRMTDDGHVVLGKWRVNGERLELDFLGETDSYSLTFRSATALRMSGPDSFSCSKS